MLKLLELPGGISRLKSTSPFGPTISIQHFAFTLIVTLRSFPALGCGLVFSALFASSVALGAVAFAAAEVLGATAGAASTGFSAGAGAVIGVAVAGAFVLAAGACSRLQGYFVWGAGSGPPGLYGRAGVHPRRLPLRRHSLKREGQLTISVSPSISAGFSRYPTRLAARGPRVFLSARGK